MEHKLLTTSLTAFASNDALFIGTTAYTYRDLDLASRQIALRLTGKRVAVLGGRTFGIYASIVAAIRSGRTYIPLSDEQPDRVLLQQLALARPDILVVDRTTRTRARKLLASALPMFCLEADQALEGCQSIQPASDVDQSSELALYEMFTSGTTGQPKRIAIPRSNVADYLGAIESDFDFNPTDRFSQFFKLSFDLSVHDLLVAWRSGGCLFVPSDSQLIDPVSFAKRHDLTVWFSVPSLVRLAILSKRLRPNSLPNIRHALFCGEALSQQVATAFAEAARNAFITNLYGPTEATIAITSKRYRPNALADRLKSQGSLPIGRPFAGQEAVVVDVNLMPLPKGQVGELLLGGSQLAPGYSDAADLTAGSFFWKRFAGFNSERWYRTGDLAQWNDVGDELIFVGRMDTQIKFRGHRIELDLIEAMLAEEADSPLAVVIPSYANGDNVTIEKLVGFVAAPGRPVEKLRRQLSDRLPSFMVPAEFVEIPADAQWRNKNGKVDREKLSRWHADRRLETIDGR